VKRIAFACENDQGMQADMSMHFGRCPYFTLVDVEEKEIKAVTVVENPAFTNHVPGVVPQFISEQKADVMIAGGMGPKAIDMFSGYGIDVATGVGGPVQRVLEAYLEGTVTGTEACKHDHGAH